MTLLSLPAWIEILLNVIGYAGFIGIATWHANFARWNARFAASIAASVTGWLPVGDQRQKRPLGSSHAGPVGGPQSGTSSANSSSSQNLKITTLAPRSSG